MEKGTQSVNPRAKIQLIALDLDGTVLNTQKHITKRTLDAIRAAIAQGVTVIPATGRLRNGLTQEFLDIEGVRYALTANGAAVLDLQTGERLFEGCLSREEALWQYRATRKWDVMFDVYSGGVIATERRLFPRLSEFAPAEMLPYFHKTRTCVDDMEAFITQCSAPIEKVTMLFTRPEERLEALEALADGGRFLVTTSIPGNAEVNAKGVDKGVGLLALAKHLGIAQESVMACGDSSNDAAMLRAAGFAVAMGNATPDIRALADVITDTNDEDGVAKAIEKYVLAVSRDGSGGQQ